MDPSTVCRTVSLFDVTGGVIKLNYPENPGTLKFEPGIYLREVIRQLVEDTGTEVHTSTVGRFLHESGFIHQGVIIADKQRNKAEYVLDVSIYKGHPELFVFVDEIGADRRDGIRKFAYCMRGKPATAGKLMVRGHRVCGSGRLVQWNPRLSHDPYDRRC